MFLKIFANAASKIKLSLRPGRVFSSEKSFFSVFIEKYDGVFRVFRESFEIQEFQQCGIQQQSR